MKRLLFWLVLAVACIAQTAKVGRVPKAEADKIQAAYVAYLDAKCHYETLRSMAIEAHAPKDNSSYLWEFSEDFRSIVARPQFVSTGSSGWISTLPTYTTSSTGEYVIPPIWTVK